MTLAALIERIEAGEGEDRELDAQIVAALNNASVRRYPPTDDFGPKSRWQFWSLDGAHFLGNESRFPVPPLTGSLDAVTALAERVLPPVEWNIERYASGKTLASIVNFDFLHEWIEGKATSEPRARLAALLRALDIRALSQSTPSSPSSPAQES